MKNTNTKTLIADSFKKLSNTKPVSKITVTDIIKDCNINRNTFYYHFEDIIDLFKWIHQKDVLSYVKNVDLLKDTEEVSAFLSDYLTANKVALISAFEAFSQTGLKRIFYDDYIYIAKKLVDNVEASLGLSVDPEYKKLVYAFYTEAVFGLILTYLQETPELDMQKLQEYFRIIFMSSIAPVLSNGPKA